MEKVKTPKTIRNLVLPYTTEYQDTCFALWYKAGKPVSIEKILTIIPEDYQGRRPFKALLYKWVQDWKLRGDALDAEASNILDKDLIGERVAMLERQAQIGVQLQQMGEKYFLDNDLNDPAVALRAIVQGVNIERNSRGLSVALQRISSMSDEALQTELNKQLARYKLSQGDIVDGDIVSSDDTVSDDEDLEQEDDA